MRLSEHPDVHLTYCLNVHPGERLEDVRAALGLAAEVRARVAPDRPFGVGLRLGAEAAAALDGPPLDAFRRRLGDLGLYAFTINGFPYGPFHGRPVKANVYTPDWRTAERLAYTRQLARILAALLPDGVDGSISTVPGGFAPGIRTPGDRACIADGLLDAAADLVALRGRTGRTVRLGLEPEPGCLLETTGDWLRFADRDLLARLPAWNAAAGRPARLTADELHRHLGLCLDACHAAVEGGSIADDIRRLQAAGWPVVKAQLSAALRTENQPDAREALRAFADPVYLHQARALTPEGRRLAWNDLPEALSALERLPPATGITVHAHVPLGWPGAPPLCSTRDALDPAVWDLLRSGASPHLEIETYTFDVLPPALRARGVVQSVADEFAWVLRHWAAPREGV
jgi:sugar phosphate isomerase/epimerase